MNENERNTIRDYIAIKAMEAYLQTNIRRLYTPQNWLKMILGKTNYEFITSYPNCDKMAKTCYRIADEMLAARKENNNEQQ